ncbi:MAG: SusC/RagA family TonB-linked outer membrane protein, partial [Alistipes sp.]|nr:SusC/RagA family TonB-linked outer membrane protein [Alistipes sp.]
MNKNGFLQTGCFAILKKYRYFLSFLLLIAFSSQTFAQNVPVTLSVTDTRLETVLEAIEQQTNYYFVYDTSIDVGKLVSVDADGKNLRDVLEELFRGTGISYRVANNSIVLSLQPREVAQARTVAGTVTDSDGNIVIGATITVKGQSIGVTTGPEGKYSITLPAGSNTLVYSFMGLETQEVNVGSRTQIDVTLNTAALAIDDVVVTALGIKRSEKALSYNVQQVSADELTRVKDANLVNALSGKVAGVTINSGSGGVGSAAKVVMRGTKGIDKSNNALYVIDGIPMFNFGGEGSTVFGSTGSTEAIADINPEDIESLTVLTGAAASALYGNNAANGVIVVNTKRGSEDRTVVTVSSNIDLSNPFVLPEFQTRYGTGDLTVLGGSTIRSWGHRLNKDNYMGYSPRKDFFQTGVTYQNNVSVSTGNARNQTYFSAAAVNSDGIVPNTQYDRFNFTFRNTFKFYQDKVTLDLGASYIIQNDQNMINQGLYSNPVSSAYLFPRGDDWSMIKIFERYDASRKINTQYWPQGLGDYRLQNPYWIAYRNLKTNKKHRYMFNATLKYEILDWLDVSGRVRVDESVNDFEEKLFSSTDQTLAGANGSYHITRAKDRQVYADVLVNMNKTFGDFTLSANVGASISDLNWDALYSGGPIRDDGIPNVFNVYQLDNTLKNSTQSGWSEQTQSIFASVEVGYKSMYYLTVTGRNDWPSHLAGSTQSGFFYPSVGLSAILSEIFSLPREISYLKLRGSFASVGLPPSRGLTTLTYSWDNDSQKWEEKTHYPIGNLKAERTDSWEVGLSARFLGHFDLDLSLYYAKTYNQTFDPQLSVSSRYDKIYVQTGSVLNKGIEAGLGYNNRWNDWRLGSYATFSLNRNKI